MEKETAAVLLFSFAFLLLTILVVGSYQETDISTNDRTNYVPGEIVVKFKTINGSVADSIYSLNQKYRASMKKIMFETGALSNIYKINVPRDTDIFSIINEYRKNKYVEYAEPNYIRKVMAVPNDAQYSQQWSHQNIKSEQGWDIERGNENITIAIVDTGVDWDHPDLATNIWSNVDETPDNGMDDDSNGYVDDIRGWDFVDTNESCATGEDCKDRDNNPMDFHGHGTHCSGIAAAVTNNSIGMAGVCWNCKIMALRAGFLASNGYGYLEDDDIAAAIIYAADNNASVISMSWGGYENSSLIKDVLDYAYSKGVVLIAAAGNDGADIKLYPAALENVIAVAATGKDDSKAYFSNYGSWVDVAAPGVAIHSTMFDDAYASWSGTSMATPHVAGLAGLLRSKNSSLMQEDIRKILRISADDVGLPGFGRINVHRALQIEKIPKINATIINPVDGSEVKGTIEIKGTADAENFKNYKIEYGVIRYINWTSIYIWTLIAQGTSPLNNTTLAVLNVSDVPDGYLIISLSVTESVYNYTETASVGLYVWDNRFAKTNGSIISSVNLADLNNDGKLEVVINSYDGYVYAWDSEGNNLPGWPVQVGWSGGYMGEDLQSIPTINQDAVIKEIPVNRAGIDIGFIFRIITYISSPAIGDIDGDGKLEVVVGITGTGSSLGSLFAIRNNGSFVQGWPVYLWEDGYAPFISSSPTLVDMNNDGKLEIIVRQSKRTYDEWGNVTFDGGNLYILSYNGTPLPGWPVQVGYPSITAPNVGDLDGDGDLEVIVVGAETNYSPYVRKDYVYAFHSNGSAVSGWPKIFDKPRSFVPYSALGDVDGDGKLEVVARVESQIVKDYWSDVYVWKADGTPMPGWPQRVGDGYYYNQFSLGDLDEDGDLEIVFSAVDYPNRTALWLYAFHHDGNAVAGWPVSVSALWNGGGYPDIPNTPVIFDIDGDGNVEVVSGVWNGFFSVYVYVDFSHVYAWNSNGTLLNISELYGGGGVSTIAAGDVDRDGRIELFIGGYDGYVYRFKEGTMNYTSMEWPMFYHDKYHTGRYSKPAAPSILGDVDGNCIVNILDLAMVGRCFNQTPEGICIPADIRGNGVIDVLDLATVGKNFGRSC